MTSSKTLKWFFWVAFAVFLVASIPHVAYFFKSFEPDGWWYWLIAYAIAISIDITTFLLSLTVAELRHRKVPNWLVASVWVFIAGLALLSWGMNWEYALQFQSAMLSKATQFPLVAFINPIIASMFQALAIAYTWISDKIYIQETGLPAISTQAPEIATATAEISEPKTEIHEILAGPGLLQLPAKPAISDEAILQYLADHPEMRQKEIALQLGISESRISRVKKIGA